MERRPELDSQVEAAVRRYLATLARRYAPMAVGLLTLALVVAFVPTVNQKNAGSNSEVASGAQGQTGPGTAGASGAQTAAGGPGSTAAGTASGIPADGATAAPGSGGTAVAGGAAGGTSGGGGGSAAASGVPAPAAQSGTTRGGVECKPGVKQVAWSAYAPPCVPAFTGDNGGATSHGVSKDSIVITFRKGNSSQDTAVYAAAADAAPAPDPDFIADMQTYVDLMNKQYELYGRKFVLKPFQGQGDYIQEDMGQGQAAAAADAATARDLGAFADATFFLKGSQPFWTALARQKVVAFGPLGFPDSWYQRNAPYWYSPNPTGSQAAKFVANVTCRRLNNLPALFAGDPLYQRTTRAFGLITPENPEYMGVGDEIVAGLRSCNAKVVRRVSYSINVATFQAQATNMVAQLKSAGATTALCFCDPLVPIFLSQAADQQQYRPEWTEPYYRDPQGRLMSQSQWAHAFSNGGEGPPKIRSEAYRVFKLAKPNEEPKEQYYDVAYYTVLMIFNGLQAAGPRLTPESLQNGYFSLPATPRGDVGTWRWTRGVYSPNAETQVGAWDPNTTSVYDGKKGGWRACEGGAWFLFSDPNSWGPAGTQLKCPGH